MGATGRDRSEAEVRESRLRDLLQRVWARDPWSRYGVHGIGIGRKVVDGVATDQLALRFHVERKFAEDEVPPERRIPSSFDDDLSDGSNASDLPTDVVEAPAPRLHAPDLGSEVRPVPGGASISALSNVGTGTMGGWVFDHTDDTIVMLSNFHVLGDDAGGEVIQPGTADGGQSGAHRIGTVKRGVPITAAPGTPTPADCNLVDAAVAAADHSDLFNLTVADIGPAVYVAANPVEGMAVEKTGQTTGHTTGVVTDAPFNTIIGGFPDIGDAVMCDCIRIAPTDPADLWGSDGDSGSLVFAQGPDDELPAAVALHFGGGGVPPNNWGIACRIDNVFAALDLGPVCDGGFAAFIEAAGLGGEEDRGQAPAVLTDGVGRSAGTAKEGGATKPPASFTARERRRRRRATAGLARDVQRRLGDSKAGRRVVAAVSDHRADLLSLLVSDGDVRRSATALLDAVMRSAVTTSDVLAHRVTEDDIRRLDTLVAQLDRKAGLGLRRTVTRLRSATPPRPGTTVAELLDLEP